MHIPQFGQGSNVNLRLLPHFMPNWLEAKPNDGVKTLELRIANIQVFQIEVLWDSRSALAASNDRCGPTKEWSRFSSTSMASIHSVILSWHCLIQSVMGWYISTTSACRVASAILTPSLYLMTVNG